MTEKSTLIPSAKKYGGLSPPIFAAGRGDLEWWTQNDRRRGWSGPEMT